MSAPQPLTLRLASNLVGACEGCFCDSIGVLGIIRVLKNRVPRACHHSFSPWSDERKLSILLGNYHEAHLCTARSIRQPTVSGPGADWSFISSREGISGNKYLLVSGFRTAIPNHHVAKFCRRTLRLLAFSSDRCDDDFSRLGGPHVDGFRLAGKSRSSRVMRSLKICDDIDILLSVKRAAWAK